ncbi:hypothetical protein pb186bvf_012648 [Paramecium bursaria]
MEKKAGIKKKAFQIGEKAERASSGEQSSQSQDDFPESQKIQVAQKRGRKPFAIKPGQEEEQKIEKKNQFIRKSNLIQRDQWCHLRQLVRQKSHFQFPETHKIFQNHWVPRLRDQSQEKKKKNQFQVVQEALEDIGGYLIGNNLINQCHKLDLDNHHWSNLPECLTPVLGCILVFFHNQLFKIGGIGSGGKSSNIVEKLDGQWRLINFRMTNFCLPSFSFGLHANPAQIFLFGGSYQTQQERIEMTKVIIMNIDLQAQIVESGEDFVYIEFFSNDALEYGKFGSVQQISINDRYNYLTQYDNQSFVEIRKIKI